MVIPQPILADMVAHARDGSPLEVCGLLAGSGGRVQSLYRITNKEQSPTIYVMDPVEQLNAVLDIEDKKGLEVLAVYHSHPATEPRPSKTDIQLAQWPGIEYLIVGLADFDNPDIRTWRIESGSATPTEFKIESDGDGTLASVS